MARVKALLDDVFRPDNLYSLNAIHLWVTADLAKEELIRQRKQTLIDLNARRENLRQTYRDYEVGDENLVKGYNPAELKE